MASPEYDKKPKPGDLIEIFRGTYQHWAIYVGDGYVIHLAPPSECAQAGASSLMSVFHKKATVKKERLYEVVGDDKYRINNLLDDKYEPRRIRVILQVAYSLLGQELPYDILSQNCEHFVTELRYGKPQSRQVRQAVEIVGAAAAAIGVVGAVFAVASAFLDSKDKEKRKQ